ncbi:hypothetical protein J1N35_016700 [Gossypium stocksii]|uniref:Uncharacterized protein n=1 Tax=Gossypium stocksii TaxID=47602 RepID=A0A9D3VML1_9ROSI|nr:hypothetical protein J1N35_016700 [Gossypium stocksii]
MRSPLQVTQNNSIDLLVDGLNDAKWKLTGFNGFLEASRKRASWDLFRSLAQLNTLPRVCICDFNNLLSITDKWGGTEYPPRWYEEFRECIANCHLVEIPLTGVGYTCERGARIV